MHVVIAAGILTVADRTVVEHSCSPMAITVMTVFAQCANAMRKGVLIQRESSQDKEFHFQNWFKRQLQATRLNFEQGGRNSYPDFRLVKFTDGFEVKGLAYPGRVVNFDSNSQPPTGHHNGRTIYYVFGRYPKKPDGNAYPVLDLVICHGDVLNAEHEYVHKNRSVRGFGSYGDILIRDRKMYVVPTPFGLVSGVAHEATLILPAEVKVGKDFVRVGQLTRVEAGEIVVGYSFNLRTNELTPEKVANPGAGRKHTFTAWRQKGSNTEPVSMQKFNPATIEQDASDDETE